MAKYVLNYTKNGPRTVNCAILDENILAESYTVQFDNGVIKNVEKRRVRNLDHIDEAVLDKLKAAGSKLVDKVATSAKMLYDNVKKMIMRLFSPTSILSVAAEKIDGLSFYPSQASVALAGQYGYSAKEVVDESGEDPVFIKDANDFLKKYVSAYEKGDNKAIEELLESQESLEFFNEYRLTEGIEDQSLKHKSWPNVGTQEVVEALLEQYDIVKDGEAFSGDSEDIAVPYCIWGAPGVGKTQIIKSVVKKLQSVGIPADIIEINAMAMRKDDFSLPGKTNLEQVVITKSGKKETFSSEKAAELAKTWLPAWDPADIDEDKGITAEVLDDIKNGGDGSGNGAGGIFFIDELSRIEGQVLNVIMTLVQNRQFNGLRLGSKWMFVAAANRPSDLGRFKSRFYWDEAMTGRFQHVNFVPTFKEWKVWAEEVDEETGRPHILPQFVEFLTEHKEAWYSIAMRNKEDEEDTVSSTLHPGPRGWEIASKDAYTKMRARARATSDPGNSVLAKIAQKEGGRIKSPVLSPQELGMSLRKSVGNDAAEMFIGWAGFDKLFPDSYARDVWKLGDSLDIPFIPNDMSIDAALDKIFQNHPKMKAGTQGKIDITNKELENVIRFIIKCVDNIDMNNSSPKDSILRTIKRKLNGKLQVAPYSIDLLGKDADKYVDEFNILEDRMKDSLRKM